MKWQSNLRTKDMLIFHKLMIDKIMSINYPLSINQRSRNINKRVNAVIVVFFLRNQIKNESDYDLATNYLYVNKIKIYIAEIIIKATVKCKDNL